MHAQGIWHEDLGTPPSGNVTIGSGATDFSILAPNAPADADLGDIFSGIYHSLIDTGIDWCYITGIARSSSGVTLSFSASANKYSISSRSILFGSSYTVSQPSAMQGGLFPGGGELTPTYDIRETFSYDAAGNRTSSSVTCQ